MSRIYSWMKSFIWRGPIAPLFLKRPNRHFLSYVFVLLSALTSFTSEIYAFEGIEHRTIGDISFNVAVEMALTRTSKQNPRIEELRGSMCKKRSGNEKKPIIRTLTYGDVVQCVDVMLSPEYLFSRTMQFSNSATGFSERWDALSYSSYQCQVGSQPYTTLLFGRNIRALHNNLAHFQSHLLTSLQLYHHLALSFARDGNLAASLAANAVSDHYLQDFFAPGHLATQREGLEDLYATQIHDSYNNRGATIKLSHTANETDTSVGKIAEQVLDILESTEQKTAQNTFFELASTGKPISQIPIRLQILAPPPFANPEGGLKGLETVWGMINADLTGDCQTIRDQYKDVTDPIYITLSGELDTVIKDLKTQLRATGIIAKLHGDDMLWREWKNCPTLNSKNGATSPLDTACRKQIHEALTQRIVMIIANTTSINEVMNTYLQGQETLGAQENTQRGSKTGFGIANAFWPGNDLNEHSYDNAPNNLLMPAGLATTYENGNIESGIKYLAAEALTPEKDNNAQQTPPPASRTERAEAPPKPLEANIPFRAYYNRESMFSHDVSRNFIGLEARTLAKAIPSHADATPKNIFLGLGPAYYQESTRSGSGVSGAVGLSFPDFSGAVNIFVRRMDHKTTNQSAWGNGYGFSVDFGFSSMFNASIGVVNDIGFDTFGTLRRGWLFMGGIGISAPLSRIVP